MSLDEVDIPKSEEINACISKNHVSKHETEKFDDELIYGVTDRPPIYLCIFLGLQQALMALPGCLSISFVLADLICAEPSDRIRSQIFCTTLFMCGVCTTMQSCLGIRLPIFQGPSQSFILPLMALKNFGRWQCIGTAPNAGDPNVSTATNYTSYPEMEEARQLAMNAKLQELQGSLMVASLVQMLLGCTGLIGLLLRFIGPITVAPTISLIGLSLFKVAIKYAPSQWGITALTVFLVVFFALFLHGVQVPLPVYRRNRGLGLFRIPLFRVFPIILSIIISWTLCYVLTITEIFSADPTSPSYMARTDAREKLVLISPWIYFPHPGQYGSPSFSAGALVGMLAATAASTVESLGDYYACAKVCNQSPPPIHAMNRGVATEGLGSILSGAFGAGHATTSYSANIGAINITKVASRSVFIAAGIIAILLSVVSKSGAMLVSIPSPVLGGIQIIIFGMLTSIGLSVLQFVDLGSSRNLMILGISLFSGLLVPEWIFQTPQAISTGVPDVDQMFTVFFGTPMFLGGILALLLDNIVPGTDKERGILVWRPPPARDPNTSTSEQSVYSFHPVIMRYLFTIPLVKRLPFLPPYTRRTTVRNKIKCAALPEEKSSVF